MKSSRRQILGGVGAIAASGVMTKARAAMGEVSLARLAQAKGVRFGAVAGIAKGGLHDWLMAGLLSTECAIVVPENEMKIYALRPEETGAFNFAPGDEIVAFAQTHTLAVRGHNLLWAKDKYLPKWLLAHDFGPRPKVAAEAFLRDHIARVCAHYGDAIVSWDVVNEAIDEKTGALRDTLFMRLLGQDYLRICFEAAREALPHTQLVYNDYMGWGGNNGAHRQGVLDLMHWFRDQKVPVDALGVQGHIGTEASGPAPTDGSAPDSLAWTRFLDANVAQDYGLLLTEFDVNDRKFEGDITARDAAVAHSGRAFLDVMLNYKQLKDVLCWGLCDRYSWLQSTTPRVDGARLRPTPYDEDFKPKPLRTAMADALRAAPQR